MDFNTALDQFIAGAQSKYDEHQENFFPNADRGVDVTVETSGGTKFIRIARVERVKEDGGGYKAGEILTSSAYAFVAKDEGFNRKLGYWKAGDVFKPEIRD